jgi:predicted 3-demethylubiquinone-9 3-methyltransferase (glyoxalase superfamily)
MNTESEQKIIPYLWFPGNAEEAVDFYVAAFSAVGEHAKVGSVSRYGEATEEVSGMPAGTVMTEEFELAGQKFIALNGGPEFNFTPAISFFVSCQSKEAVSALWEKLSQGGETLMALDAYPFSEWYGWLNDRYGVSWQLILAPAEQKITPALMFVGENFGKAEEAINLYTSLFQNSAIGGVARYGPEHGTQEGKVAHARFTLAGQDFIAMESDLEHNFTFTEATSLFVRCAGQEEVDYFWNNLTAEGGEEGPCGWLKDRYGVSWQIVPAALMEMLSDEDPEKAQRAMEAMLQMKKIEIDQLRKAYEAA